MEENQRRLEACMSEFYAPQTSNTRKREIEIILEQFLKGRESWKQALYSLRTDSSDFVIMYCQSVLENTIKTRWYSMSYQDQSEIMTGLHTFLIQKSSESSPVKCSPFIRNKVIKLLSDIGKLSWPQQQPDFFSNILQATKSPETVVVGLWFIKTISEEWTNICDEASTQRKLELKVNLIKQVPSVFNTLESILDAGIKHKGSASAQSSQNSVDEIISLALEAAAHLTSWVTLDGSLPSMSQEGQEVKTVPFQLSFVQLLCQYAVPGFQNPNAEYTQELSHAIQALCVLNELCYRKYIPQEFSAHMRRVTHFGIEILNKLLNRPANVQLSVLYLEKVIEFLCLIAGSHFNQYDDQNAKAFLSLLLPFTFGQTETIFYYECLGIWGRLLDHVNTQLPIVTQFREDYIETYKQPIMALANGIIHSTAKYQVAEEEFINVEDDEVETPSLARNIDILVKVGELLPAESLESLITTWTESCRFFGSLQSLLDPTSKRLMHIGTNRVEIEHFHFIVQLIGRMANVFYSDVFKQEVTLGKSLFQQLVGVYNFSQRFYFVKEPDIIVKMNCEIVSSLSLWTYWLQRFHSEVILGASTLEDQQMFFELLGILTEVVFFTLENQAEIDTSILVSNLNSFLTLLKCVRTQFIFQISSVQTLIRKVHLLKDSTNPEVYRLLNRIVSAVLLLPWQSVSQQEWETRTNLYESYMKLLLEEFGRSVAVPATVICHINFLQDQLELLVTENAHSKKICWNVLKEVVPFLHTLSATYLRQPKVSEAILSFFSKIMEVLRQQAGAPFFETTIQGFLTLFSSANIINDLLEETESSSIVVEKFLGMLQFIVKDASTSFKKFLGDTLSICYDQIYPVLSQRSTPDLKIPFFSLVRETLNYRWNYFFPNPPIFHSKTATTSSPSSATQSQGEEETIRKRLDQMIQSIGNSFLQQDLEVFRFNLNTLSILNEKHSMYVKLPGTVTLQFMRVLLQILVQKSHDLYREEVCRVLHDLAVVDYGHFRGRFLEEFVQSTFPTIPAEHRNALTGNFRAERSAKDNRAPSAHGDGGIDLPTFIFLLNGFVDDLRHFYFLVECQKVA